MDVKLAALADFASVSIDKKLNILGIFQEINTPNLPVAVPHIYLVLSLEAGPEEYGKKILIRVALLEDNDGGGEMLHMEGLAEVPHPRYEGDRAFANQVIGLSGVTFERAGNYRFSVSVENEEIAVVPLRVNKLE
jgi:uncharacterized protein DUF6941